MLEAIVAEQTDPAIMAQFARGRMRHKGTALEQALAGRVRDHHRFLLAQHLIHRDFLDQQIDLFDQRIIEHLAHFPGAPDVPAPLTHSDGFSGPLSGIEAVALLDTIPGVERRTAEVIVAEIGCDMRRFPSADHLAAWAGVSPSNNESAGKQRSGKTGPGNRTLRQALVQAAHGAAHTRHTYLSTQYHRLAARRGKKRAIMAVAHSILIAAYHILSRREPYYDLGDDFFDKRHQEAVVNRLVRRLQKLGYEVALEPCAILSPPPT
jgi:transposase